METLARDGTKLVGNTKLCTAAQLHHLFYDARTGGRCNDRGNEQILEPVIPSTKEEDSSKQSNAVTWANHVTTNTLKLRWTFFSL